MEAFEHPKKNDDAKIQVLRVEIYLRLKLFGGKAEAAPSEMQSEGGTSTWRQGFWDIFSSVENMNEDLDGCFLWYIWWVEDDLI